MEIVVKLAGMLGMRREEIAALKWKNVDLKNNTIAIVEYTYGGGLFCRLTDDTNVMCMYEPGMFTEEFYIEDEALIKITQYDYEQKLVYGKILTKW